MTSKTLEEQLQSLTDSKVQRGPGAEPLSGHPGTQDLLILKQQSGASAHPCDGSSGTWPLDSQLTCLLQSPCSP